MSKKTESLLQQILDKLGEIADNQATIISIVRENQTNTVTLSSRDDRKESFQEIINNKEWGSIIKKRKIAYYKKIRNEGIKKEYEQHLKDDPPRIPQKFREHPFPGQSDAQTQRMKKLEITKLELEIERLEEEKVKNESIISNAECEIKQLIGKNNDAETRQKLNEIWFNEIRKEEKLSEDIWKKKENFLLNKEYEREQDRGTIEPNQRNKMRGNSYGKKEINRPFNYRNNTHHKYTNRRNYYVHRNYIPQQWQEYDLRQGERNYYRNSHRTEENFPVPHWRNRRT